MSEPTHGTPFLAPEVEEVARLFPNYEIIRLIACGGMGAVYHAIQTSLERPVAIKILPREFSTDQAFRDGFESEAKAMAKLNHPNLIGVYDFGEVEGMLFIVMEFVAGLSLFQAAHGCAVEHADAIAMTVAVCNGLAHAHEYGILHRDIKPSNILLDGQNNPKIGDFGLARALERQIEEGEQIFGTPGYTAPEVLQPPFTIDQRADIFSVGVMLHELLTGHLPDADARPASQICGCSHRLDAVIQRATQPDPKRRYHSAMEMAQELAKIAAMPARTIRTGAPASLAKPAGTPPSLSKPAAPALSKTGLSKPSLSKSPPPSLSKPVLSKAAPPVHSKAAPPARSTPAPPARSTPAPPALSTPAPPTLSKPAPPAASPPAHKALSRPVHSALSRPVPAAAAPAPAGSPRPQGSLAPPKAVVKESSGGGLVIFLVVALVAAVVAYFVIQSKQSKAVDAAPAPPVPAKVVAAEPAAPAVSETPAAETEADPAEVLRKARSSIRQRVGPAIESHRRDLKANLLAYQSAVAAAAEGLSFADRERVTAALSGYLTDWENDGHRLPEALPTGFKALEDADALHAGYVEKQVAVQRRFEGEMSSLAGIYVLELQNQIEQLAKGGNPRAVDALEEEVRAVGGNVERFRAAVTE